MLGAGTTGPHTGGHENLSLRGIVAIERADLKQGCVGETTVGIAACSRDEPRQQRWTHDVEIGADRVDEPQFRLDAAEELGFACSDERERHRLDETALGECAAHQLRPPLRRRERRARQRLLPLQRHGRDSVIALDPQHLLDEIRLTDNIAAPRRRLYRELPGRESLDRAAEGGEDPRALLVSDVETAEVRRPLGSQHIPPPPIRHRTGRHNIGCLAAANLEH
jgi:hypothetical protein